jgi:hypothetical protein
MFGRIGFHLLGAYTFGVDTVLCGEGEVSVPLFVVDG